MQKTAYLTTISLCTLFLLLFTLHAPAQDSRARVEEILSYFPAGLYSNVHFYDFEAIHAAPTFDLYNKHFSWERREQKELGPLPKIFASNVSSLAKAIRVRFRVSGWSNDPKGYSRPDILLDKKGNYQRNLNVTNQSFTMYGDKRVAIVNFGRTFRVYRIIGLDDLLKKAIKDNSIVKEDGSILGVSYYSIQSNSAGVPYLCCTVEPDVLLLAEDKSMLEDLVAVSSGEEADLSTEEYYDEVIFLGPELGQTWSLLNSLMNVHPSVIRRLIDFGIPEELLDERIQSTLEEGHFFASTHILGTDIIEREMDICGSEAGAQTAMAFRKSNQRYNSGDDAPEEGKAYNRAYNAAWKISCEKTIVTADVNYDKDLLALRETAGEAWQKKREEMNKEKEVAKKKDTTEKK